MRKSQLPISRTLLVIFTTSILPLAAQQISDTARRQMADVLTVKSSLNRSQRKLSSNLIFASMKARNQSTGAIPETFIQKNLTDAADGVVVEVTANSVSAAMTQINAVGGTILSNSATGTVIRARVPLLSLETVAASNAVRTIRTPSRVKTNSVRPQDAFPFVKGAAPYNLPFDRSHQILKAEVQSALPLLAANGFYPSLRSLPNLHVQPFVGAVTTQGYVTHMANRSVPLGYDGTGVRVGVLSDSASASRVAALIASGDLPPDVVVLPGQDGGNGTDEGTALMEIVHDMAPAAKLFFATAFTGEQSFADNVRTLRFTYHCDIIVDDVTYFDEAVFQDGIVAVAVNDVTADGGLYFSSAANSGNVTHGTSGVWEGDFNSAGDAGILIDSYEKAGVLIHNFGPSTNPMAYDTLAAGSPYLYLQWSDPLGASNNDYDFFLLNQAGTAILGASIMTQDGTQDPLEYLETADGSSYPAGSRVVVVLYSGNPRALHVDSHSRLEISTSGATFGHNAARNTVGVAATAWNSAHRGTAVFSAANGTETFSSDGPRQIFYQPDGAPITPGNFLFGTNGGSQLQKPDLTAADGVYTKTPGFLPFFGTSAAVAHAGGIAALVKSANPALTNAQIRQIMVNTAVDDMGPGSDRDSGYGITLALPAVQAALQP